MDSIVHLEKRQDAAVAQIGWNRLAMRFAIHCAIKQNGAKDLRAREGGCADDSNTHFMDKAEHMRLICPTAIGNAIGAKSAWG
jgi:hypothetical protein